MRYKKGGHDYAGATESKSATYKTKWGDRKDRKEQKKRVLGISSKQDEDFTKKQKRSTKRIMRKSDRMYNTERRQGIREIKTGSKHGKGIIGKVREKVSGIAKKRRTKGINRNMDKLSDNQAFNVGRRYTPGKTYMYKGKERSEKLRSEVPQKKDSRFGKMEQIGMRKKQKGGALDAAGMVPGVGMKPDSKNVDYNSALSLLGLVPAMGTASKAAKVGKGAKKGKKYLKGGQVKLDKNKDGKISGADFKMMKKGKKKKGGTKDMYKSGGFLEPGIENIFE